MRTPFKRVSTLATVLAVALACNGSEPTAPVADRSAPPASLRRTSPTSTYVFSLGCSKDASVAGNVGLAVWNDSFQRLYFGALRCGESVVAGPGASQMYYNINVYDGRDWVFSCDSGIEYVPVEAGKYRCQLRDAGFLVQERKGVWVVLTITPA